MPWAGMQMQQIMMAVAVRKRVPDVPDSVPAAETVRRCFAFEPSARPAASELADALRPEAAELPEIVGGMAREFSKELQRVTEEKRALVQEVQRLKTRNSMMVDEIEALRLALTESQHENIRTSELQRELDKRRQKSTDDLHENDQKSTLMFGNPGVGKAALLNALVGKPVFRSSISSGKGLTQHLRSYTRRPGALGTGIVRRVWPMQ